MTALEAALAYQQAGWSIIPATVGDKRALAPWRRWQTVVPDPEQLARWGHQWPRANWALITGPLSGVVVLDIDIRHRGDRALAELEQRHGDLPWTCVVETPSGGWHAYLRHPGGRIPNSASRIGLGVDIRGDNGLALLPPSRRPDGTYRWAVGDPTTVPEMPAAWAELLRPAPRPPDATQSTRAAAGADFAADPSRNAARFAGHLRTLRQAPDHQRNNLLHWCACRLAEMVAAGAPTSWAEDLIRVGIQIGLEPDECRRSVASGIGTQP